MNNDDLPPLPAATAWNCQLVMNGADGIVEAWFTTNPEDDPDDLPTGKGWDCRIERLPVFTDAQMREYALSARSAMQLSPAEVRAHANTMDWETINDQIPDGPTPAMLEAHRRLDAAYAKANPLGGPAKVFDAIADRIRAGEPIAEVMEDMGVQWARRLVTEREDRMLRKAALRSAKLVAPGKLVPNWNARTAARSKLDHIEFIKHEGDEDGYSEWVTPKPDSYLMKCCDCGLVHEAQFRVAKFKPRPSEDFEVVADPDLQAQFRMRRACEEAE